MASEVTPIWKDLKYTYNSLPVPEYLDYTLRRDSATGAVIYTGRAYRRPGASEISFSVNSIVADYLSNAFPFSAIPAGIPDSLLETSVNTECGLSVWIAVKPAGGSYGAFSELGYYQNDWAYYDGQYYYIPGTVSTWGGRSVCFLKHAATVSSGETRSDRIIDCRMPLITTGTDPWAKSFKNRVFWQKATGGETAGSITQPDGVVIPWLQASGRRTCYDYALYFLCAFGGWSFIYLDAVKQTQSYDRKTAKRFYDSADLKARGTVNYVNQVTQGWDAKTPYLDDEQAAKFWHVAGTTAAYLFDMVSGTWYPVNVAGTSWDAKTYKNQGIKRPRYDIKLTLAQDRLRR